MTLISQPYSLSLFLTLIRKVMVSDKPEWFAGVRKTAREIGAACKEIEPLAPDVLAPVEQF